ncbi:MAG: VCBS repeat-containing protein [Sediminibacterium sp.]|nr:VCBS repeat-containing protein [Sediminibacterium sp.]
MFNRNLLTRIFLLLAAAAVFNVSCRNRKTLFTQLPESQTGIGFTNKLEAREGLNILYYLYYYNGAGVATGDINNDGLPDIYFTSNAKGKNKLYLNKGNFQFEDITDKAGVKGISDWCTGVTMADINADGFLDIYVSTVSGKYGLKGHNELYINNGKGAFTESAAQYGLNTSCLSTQAAFFDYDHDGDLDCYILNQSSRPHANIVDTSNRRNYDSLAGDRLFRNDIATTGKFTDVSAAAGIYQSNLGYGLGLAVADINNDGWDDIYIGNDFHENDYYYVNQQNGSFKEEGADHFRHYSRFSMGNDVADYNNDGQLDLVTADMLPPDEKQLKTYGSDENPDIYKVKLEMNGYQKQYSKNSLQRNNGNGVSFSETALLSGVAATDWSWGPLFADFDNDGNKDLFISSGIVKRALDLDYIQYVSVMQAQQKLNTTNKFDDELIAKMPDGSAHPFLFKGNGHLGFTDVSADWGTAKMKGYYNGASYADLDVDGRVDIVINAIDAPAVILKNNTPNTNSVAVAFNGNNANKNGIGAKVYLFSGGQMQYQQMMPTRGFQSASEPVLHFGLNNRKNIDSLLVVWPDQQYQVVKNIAAGSKLKLNQSDAVSGFDYNRFFPPPAPLLKNITAQTGIQWKHTENDFIDYNRQYLIPHQLSARGPKLAVGDVNKDGLDDIYVCGASGQPGQLMLQTSAGQFVVSDAAVFAPQAAAEEVDALFFDANQDSWPDLYVVSGGNQFDDGNPALADHFYLNDGKGNFRLSDNQIPTILKNKSSVSSIDFDKDGDADLFVSGLADARQYGIAQPSYLLVNKGNAVFAIADSTVINLNNAGIATSTAVADLNKDGWDDLILTGEWMPLKIFLNQRGKFTETDIPASTGLWQSLYATDVNGDGYTDILAGNWGLNNKLIAGKNGPVKLYVKDFDRNGTIEQVMCYTVDGKEYSFLAKDELERALPVLKKAYLKYEEVAGKTVQFMFYDLFKDYTELKAEILASTCFLNNGKGGFQSVSLPAEMQLAPVFSFAVLDAGTKKGFIGAGNFYGTGPYEGRYDALLPSFFSFEPLAKAFRSGASLTDADGEVRDAKWIRYAGSRKALVIARSNGSLLFYQ